MIVQIDDTRKKEKFNWLERGQIIGFHARN